jgi:hypothetical protein
MAAVDSLILDAALATANLDYDDSTRRIIQREAINCRSRMEVRTKVNPPHVRRALPFGDVRFDVRGAILYENGLATA